jgi:hypothetical protein
MQNPNKHLVLATFGLGALLSSCATNHPNPTDARCFSSGETPSPIEIVSRFHSGLDSPLFLTLKTNAEWHSIWSKICHGCSEDSPEEPNFETEMLLVAAIGDHAGAYRVSFDRAKVMNGRIEVVVKEDVLGANCIITTERRQPVSVAKIKRSNCPVVFVPVREKKDC